MIFPTGDMTVQVPFLSLSLSHTHTHTAGPNSAVGSASDSRGRGHGFDTRSGHILSFLLPLIQEGQWSVTGEKYVHEGLSFSRKKLVRLTNRPDMTIDINRGSKIGWLFWVYRPFETVFQSISGRLPERGRKRKERIDENKNVQTTPTRTYCKRSRPLPYCNPTCRTPRHWKFTQHHRTTRPPPWT